MSGTGTGAVQGADIVITNNGYAKVANALLTNSNIAITQFKIGSDFGFTPSPTDTDVHTLVYTQEAARQMQPIQRNPDVIDFKIVIDPTIQSMTIGNIGLYLADGSLFALAALTEPDIQVTQAIGVVGTSYEYDLLIAVAAIGSVISPTILVDSYATIPFVPSELALPSPIAPPYEVYRIITQTDTNLSALVIQDPNNLRWLGTPFLSDAQSDYFNIMDGGVGSDVPPQVGEDRVIWGNYYTFIPTIQNTIDFGSYGGVGTADGQWDFGYYVQTL